MMHLKVYASEDVTATLLGVDATTFRHYVWYYIKKISKLSVVLVSQQNIKFFNTCIKHIHSYCLLLMYVRICV